MNRKQKSLLIRKTLIASCMAMALATISAEAAVALNVMGYPDPNYGTPEQSFKNWSTDSANFSLMESNGGIACPIGNNVQMVWDGNAYNASSDYTGPGGVANVTTSSTAAFLFGYAWTAHDIQMFTPGSYSFDVTAGGGNPEAGTLSATVGAGQLGMHMLFDWHGNNNIDMLLLFAQNSIFGSGLLRSTQLFSPYGSSACDSNFTSGTIIKNCLWDGPTYGSAGAPVKNEVWMLASTDSNGDGVMGIPMAAGGPFGGFSPVINANMTATPEVPVPAAAWLFGSGLIGLLGVSRRKTG